MQAKSQSRRSFCLNGIMIRGNPRHTLELCFLPSYWAMPTFIAGFVFFKILERLLIPAYNLRCFISLAVLMYKTGCDALSDTGGISVTYRDPGNTRNYGSVAVFRCKQQGYVISGFASRTCMSNGQWSGSPPECVKGKVQKYSVNN